MTPAIILTSLIGLFILYIICRIFLKPIKWVLKLFATCIIGCFAMYALNRLFGTSFPLNPLTAMISGVLGLPGIIMTYVLMSIL